VHPTLRTDDEFFDYCQQFPLARVERTAHGDIKILPLRGLETSFRTCEISAQLGNWARTDGRGKAFSAAAKFILPSNAALSPDASWLDNIALATLTREQKRKFPRICPDFVAELTSPPDTLSRLQKKMREWIEDGVQLGWLLDADHRTAYVYRPGCATETVVQPQRLEGEGSVAGFVLELESIWASL
jgi:Uma2 family endonuclease